MKNQNQNPNKDYDEQDLEQIGGEMKAREYDKPTAKYFFPEIWGEIPGNFEEAYELFKALDELPPGFEKSFKEMGEGWCDIYTLKDGNKIAVYGDGDLNNTLPLYIVELTDKK